MIRLAIVGLGPWGLAALDRVIAAARRRPHVPIHVTAVDPSPPGPGIHDPEESELLLLNTVAGQVDSFGAAHFGEPPLPGAMPFLDWARRNGYPGATADMFLPRAVFGRYLRFVFGVLRDAAARTVELAIVRDEVVAIEQCPGPAARCRLGGGGEVVADHVLLCTGHGVPGRGAGEAPPVPAPLLPYPVARLDATVGAARSVGVAGMGLVAVDVVAALTEGRGGRFERTAAGRLAYHPSGREPLIFPFSRSGIPFSCRPATALDLATRYEPVHCTAERVAALRRRGDLDLVADVLPPILAEMRAAYALRTLALAEGGAAAEALRRRLAATDLDDAPTAIERAVPQAAAFDPRALVLCERLTPATDPASFHAAFVRRLELDVAEARKGEAGSPLKAAIEMLRVLRDALRAGVEHDRLAPASRALFHRVIAPRIAQLIVGPPLSRGEEWLALIEAGILRLDLGAAPEIRRNWTRGRWQAVIRGESLTASTHLDCIVLGHLDDAPIARDRLWQRLRADGVCAVRDAGGRGTSRIDRDGHLVDATGQIARAVHAFGIPTEGPTYFNHYLPSPRSRAGAFERLRAVIEGAIDDSAGETPVERATAVLDDRAQSRAASPAG